MTIGKYRITFSEFARRASFNGIAHGLEVSWGFSVPPIGVRCRRILRFTFKVNYHDYGVSILFEEPYLTLVKGCTNVKSKK